jgi:LytS/YehU family sensor histidine kinase
MILNLAGLWHRKQMLNKRQYHAMLSYITIPLVSMLIQMFTYGLLLVAYGTIAGALIMFMFILSEQTDMVVSQVRENARKEFNLKVLQMRPHFIYNTMTSIYYLVDTDPQKAKKAIRDFSRYLHQNFNAVVKTELIPFTKELTHTTAYLAVEHARFGNRLEVTYDIPHTSFHLPPLTLEPIVENAVKHGMDPDSGPLHILIRTRTLENGSEVTVENNGTDFIQGESDNFNVGLNSVSERLSLMCGGTLNIMPRSGGGTVVTLTIPGSAL